MKKALVYGAQSTVGKKLIEKLKSENYWVRAVGSVQDDDSIADEFYSGDLTQESIVMTTMFSDTMPFDVVYQLISNDDDSKESLVNNLLVNINTLKYASRYTVGKVVTISSGEKFIEKLYSKFDIKYKIIQKVDLFSIDIDESDLVTSICSDICKITKTKEHKISNGNKKINLLLVDDYVNDILKEKKSKVNQVTINQLNRAIIDISGKKIGFKQIKKGLNTQLKNQIANVYTLVEKNILDKKESKKSLKKLGNLV